MLLLVALVLVACQSGPHPDRPPTIRYGEDPCDECYMLINEARYASAYVSSQGLARRFDDIGCMVIYHHKHQEDVASFWVRDFDLQEWTRAENAVFIRSENVQTPMGFGIIAAQDESIAKDARQTYQGEILNFQKLLEIAEELYY